MSDPNEVVFRCSACGGEFPSKGIAAEHIQYVETQSYDFREPGFNSLYDAIDRMIVRAVCPV
jgi:hypothetical protein